MNILGINSFFEHPSVAVVSDGRLLFSIDEERLTKIKGGRRYTPYSLYVPFQSIYAGLQFLDMRAEDIDVIAYSYNPSAHIRAAVKGLFHSRRFSAFGDDVMAYCNLRQLRRALGGQNVILAHMFDRLPIGSLQKPRLQYYDHHLCHAASAFFCSGFSESLVLVADGCGESTSTTLYIGRGTKLTKLREFQLPHSLGFLYTFITDHLGFDTFSDEYKVMGLASYGKVAYLDAFRKFVTFDSEGNYKIDKKQILSLKEILGEPRRRGEPILDRHKDIARTLQHVIESILVQLVATYARKHGLRHLCLAGGVALNCVANGAIHERGLFSEIFVQPAAGDAGTSIGAAALANVKSGAGAQLEYANMYLGTAYSSGEIAAILARSKLKYQCLDSAEMSKVIARKLSEGKIGGVFHGRMESGPRALGNRSVIADPSHPGALEAINNIKEREMFRPIAPIVKDEAFDDFFVGKRCKYMLFTCKAKADVAHKISAVVHVDGTSRVQTVDRKTNAVIYSIIEEFEKLTRIPVIVNTSLNFKGQPIIESPIDAIGNFFTSGLDFMMLENFLLEK